MPDTLRRFRRHPIYSTLGALFATVLLGLTSLVWLGALVQLAQGRAIPDNARLALAVFSVVGGWYLNFLVVYHRLRRIDPATYALATKDMGFIAYIGSTRSAAGHLHNVLTTLDLDRASWSFRLHVRCTVVLNAILLWSWCALVVGTLVFSVMHRK